VTNNALLVDQPLGENEVPPTTTMTFQEVYQEEVKEIDDEAANKRKAQKEKIERLAKELEEKTAINDEYLKKQFKKDGTRFDATQGRCCCLCGNRRGVRCIVYFDSINFLTPYRQIPAIILLCVYNANYVYKWYYYIRFISFWF